MEICVASVAKITNKKQVKKKNVAGRLQIRFRYATQEKVSCSATTYADNVALPSFARRCCCPPVMQQSLDISLRLGPRR